ncbi:MAG: trypsin-like peptidase domain-containing protein [Thermoplasmatota archaeon]
MRRTPLALLLVGLFVAAATTNVQAFPPDDIAPGDQINTGGSLCTLAFVMDGQGANAGKTYFATAGHCVGHVGQTVRFAGFGGNGVLGTVAFIAPHDTGNFRATDYAFIEVTSDRPVLTQPRGLAWAPTSGVGQADDYAVGQFAGVSGYGSGFGFTDVTAENRMGMMTGTADGVYYGLFPHNFGDSGGPVFHYPSGRALGIVSGYGTTGYLLSVNPSQPYVILPVQFEGPTMAHAISHAAGHGFHVSLR